MDPVIDMYFPKVARTQLCATLSSSAAPAQDWPHDHTVVNKQIKIVTLQKQENYYEVQTCNVMYVCII